jgi:dihydrofolate synthase / folylpolyglutamate synthase
MTSWTKAQAERHLHSLELFGMRFGLDRMRRMMTVLGSPQRRYDTIHVLGTNGKTSTTRMTAAILQRHGLRTGTYLSPHLVSYCERVQIGERDLQPDAFATAVAHAAWAAERVNRTLAQDDHVTQFELLTAAALWEMAERDVEVAVIEAGLGGRYDATSVIDSPVTVLTNVGLEHTRWLGPTLSDIAEEKLAVVHPDGTLVLGSWLAEEARIVAERVAGERRARIVVVDELPAADGPAHGTSQSSLSKGGAPDDGAQAARITTGRAGEGGVGLPAAKGSFQRRNFALARTAAQEYLRSTGIEPEEGAITAAAATVEVPGRLQVVGEHPLIVLDGAHNPDAVDALVASLPDVVGDRALGLVMGVLEDKDAAGMLATLLPVCERAWFTAPPSPRALSPAALQSLARQLGFEAGECESDPERALEQARRWAGEREDGNRRAVLATGSIYLVGELLRGLGSATLQRRQAAPGG